MSTCGLDALIPLSGQQFLIEFLRQVITYNQAIIRLSKEIIETTCDEDVKKKLRHLNKEKCAQIKIFVKCLEKKYCGPNCPEVLKLIEDSCNRYIRLIELLKIVTSMFLLFINKICSKSESSSSESSNHVLHGEIIEPVKELFFIPTIVTNPCFKPLCVKSPCGPPLCEVRMVCDNKPTPLLIRKESSSSSSSSSCGTKTEHESYHYRKDGKSFHYVKKRKIYEHKDECKCDRKTLCEYVNKAIKHQQKIIKKLDC